MKTKITLLTILVVTGLSLKAQIPNPSFESWTSSNPNGWITSGSLGITGSTAQSSDAHAGSSSVRINVVFFGASYAGLLYADNGFPVSSAPAALHGWYKFHSNSGGTEYGAVVASTQYQGAGNGGGSVYVMNNTAVYMEFVANIYYTGVAAADTANILATIGSSDSVRVGTYFIVDDLAFGAATGIQEIGNAVNLEPCSPNPATYVANIIYSIPGHSTVNLAIYDLVGSRVVSLLDNTEQNTGRYKIPADVSALPAGIYLYRLNVNGQQFTQKLVVSR